MISKDELVKKVAEKCGISPEISAFFFEVFVNRLNSKLKTGELFQIDNLGYFQKRNCRFQLEKTPDSPTGKSYLFTLILFSEEPEIKDILTSVHYLKIPDLKSLWEDDTDFQNSLSAGDFYPITERNQLIQSFATKAEVIIAGLQKNYKSELEEELIIPLTLDMNLILKTGEKTGSSLNKETSQTLKDLDSGSIKKDDKVTDHSLPWSMGTKFLEKKIEHPDEGKDKDSKIKMEPATGEKEKSTKLKDGFSAKETEITKAKIDADEALNAAIEESEIDDDQLAKLREFEPVRSRISNEVRNKLHPEDQSNFRVSRENALPNKSEFTKTEQKFTEVKSKTEAYHLRGDVKKLKKQKKILEDRSFNISNVKTKYQNYRENKNILPLIILFSFIIIAGAVIYIYFIGGNIIDEGTEKVVFNVNPPSNVNIIERDFEFSVTYPYAKTEKKLEITGVNPNAFSLEEIKPKKITEPLEKPLTEVKTEIKTEDKPKTITDVTEKTNSRIFIFNNYYVVYVGSFKSYSAADREAERYFNEGYNAYVEVEEIPGSQTRYKLNVGDFTSEKFARDFELKYIKK
jgi:nucleoid DNA-binding protein